MRSSLKRQATRLRPILDVIATIAMTVASIVLIAAVLIGRPAAAPDVKPEAAGRARPVKSIPKTPIPLADTPILGNPMARVAVLEYSDFECPYCYRFTMNTFPAIRSGYIESGKIRFGFRNLPIESKHANAMDAASAAMCAHRQGQFWKMHDALFTQPKALDSASTVAKASRLGLDVGRFEACVKQDGEGLVRKQIADAEALGITGTPTFLFGVIGKDGQLVVSRRESGAIPQKAFADILDTLLAEPKTLER